VARVIHELGGEALALWTRGGPMGALLESLLESEGIAHRPVPIEGITRENVIVFERASERLYRFGMPGPPIASGEAESCLEAIASLDPAPDYFVASGSLPDGAGADFYARVARLLPGTTRLIVDTVGEPMRCVLEEGVFLIKPNIRELGLLLGEKIEEDAQIESFSKHLIEEGKVQVVVTSLGAGGAMLVTAERTEHIISPTVRIRSSVGAGDSMVAGLVLALARGESIEAAARFGIAAGAAAVMTPGSTLCRREDVERLAAL
jgi:6-phosphofructokinase 2